MALDFGNKVENGGIPPQGVLTANEFNELVAQVNQNEEDISQIGTPNSIESIKATESQASGGNNVITITETNGTETTFNVKNGEDGVQRTLVVTTHAELVTMRDGGKLTAGALYRINDYECTTKQADTHSAGHPFDIVVMALSSDTLSEEAWAMPHAGDEYFAESKLEAWQLWYCLDNDTDRFAWADPENGKGVIYRMIDEWNNDCPYDFKNIQFKRWKVTAADDESFVFSDENPHYFGIYNTKNEELIAPNGVNAEIEDVNDWRWCYTFDGYNTDKGEQYDFSTHRNKATDEAIQLAIEEQNGEALQDMCSGNVIECYATADVGGDCTMQKMQLGNNVFFATSYCHLEDDAWNYTFAETWGNTLGQGANSNTLGQEASSNTLGQDAWNNTLGQGAQSNTLEQGASSNTLGQGAQGNTLGKYAQSNTLGQGAQSNTLEQGASSNALGQGAQSNTLEQGASRNTLGQGASSNTLGQEASSNTLGKGAYRNTLEQGAYSNTLGQGAQGNTLGKYAQSNTLGQGASSNTLGQGAYSNTLGQNCHDIVFGSYVNNVAVPKAYCRYIRVEAGVEFVNITTNATTSISQYLQNIIVGMGVKGTSSNRKTITHATVNDAKQTTYVPTNSTTVNV